MHDTNAKPVRRKALSVWSWLLLPEPQILKPYSMAFYRLTSLIRAERWMPKDVSKNRGSLQLLVIRKFMTCEEKSLSCHLDDLGFLNTSLAEVQIKRKGNNEGS